MAGVDALLRRFSHRLGGAVYANVSQLVCLSNLENLNAVFINDGIPQAERLARLNTIAISQMKILTEDHQILKLEGQQKQQEEKRLLSSTDKKDE